MSRTVAAFAYLTTRSLRNRALRQVQRLRSPRYVVALAVGCAYFLLLFHRPAVPAEEMPAGIGPVHPVGLTGAAAMELASTCLLALFTAKWWLFGSANSALAFTPAEVQMLFPAPIRRRTLVLYKIGRAQLALLVSAGLITVLARRAGAPLSPLLRGIALWVLFCTMSLHQMAAALVRAGAAQRGRGLRRNGVAVLLIGGGLLVLIAVALRAWPGVRTVDEIPSALTRVAVALERPLPGRVLAPFRIALAPSYAASTHAWLVALVPALALLLLHIVWVVRADYVFEDAAVEASARRAQRVAMARARAAGAALPSARMVDKISGSMAAVRLDEHGRSVLRPRRVPFPLGPTGDPAVALLWKNLVALLRGLRLRTVVLFGIVVLSFMLTTQQLGVLTGAPSGGGALLLGTLACVAAVFLVVLGPLAIRNDLRQDLVHLDMLRTYPLPGASLVFAEIASSTLVLTLIQWVLLGASYVALATAPVDAGAGPPSLFPSSFPGGLTTLTVAIAVLPVVNSASFVIQNAAALLFPDWVRLGSGSVGGLEVIGQRLMAFGASLIALAGVLALPTAVAVGIATLWPGDGTLSRGALVVSVVSGIVVAATELYIAIQWLGYRFDRTDATAVARP